MQLRVDINRQAMTRIRRATRALRIDKGDYRGPILTVVAQLHRKQEKEIFKTEGLAGGGNRLSRFVGLFTGNAQSGKWAPLSPAYAKRKKKLKPGRKILVWSGDMKERFIRPGRPEYIEEFKGNDQGGVFRLGASSRIAGYHYRGTKTMPRRDPITKSKAQIIECREAVYRWYRDKRIPQVVRALEAAK